MCFFLSVVRHQRQSIGDEDRLEFSD